MNDKINYRSSVTTLGLITIAFAVAFNIPYAILSMIFDYPAVLRRPAGEVLALFDAGGPGLVATWYAFGLAALLFVPITIALSLRAERIAKFPALAIGAAISGSLAGLAQAIGLWRWVFVVPSVAASYVGATASAADRLAAENTFALVNLYGGVAVGEHIGQLLTALFVLMLSTVLLYERSRTPALIGFVTAGAIAVGTVEGLAIALGQSGEIFSLATIAGFLLLTVWLVAVGVTLLRSDRSVWQARATEVARARG
jgi:hypothetical protein